MWLWCACCMLCGVWYCVVVYTRLALSRTITYYLPFSCCPQPPTLLIVIITGARDLLTDSELGDLLDGPTGLGKRAAEEHGLPPLREKQRRIDALSQVCVTLTPHYTPYTIQHAARSIQHTHAPISCISTHCPLRSCSVSDRIRTRANSWRRWWGLYLLLRRS
jgi:hypothetical protein